MTSVVHAIEEECPYDMAHHEYIQRLSDAFINPHEIPDGVEIRTRLQMKISDQGATWHLSPSVIVLTNNSNPVTR
jgi:hypothetical protein